MVTGQVLRQRRLNKNLFEYYERLDQSAVGVNQVIISVCWMTDIYNSLRTREDNYAKRYQIFKTRLW